jgi:hypothetical protein
MTGTLTAFPCLLSAVAVLFAFQFSLLPSCVSKASVRYLGCRILSKPKNGHFILFIWKSAVLQIWICKDFIILPDPDPKNCPREMDPYRTCALGDRFYIDPNLLLL